MINKTFHDFSITRFECANDSHIVLELLSESGQQCTIEFNGIIQFRVVDLDPQNIISRIVVLDKNYADTTIRDMLSWVSSKSDTVSYPTAEALDAYVTAVQKSELHLIYLEPSAGLEFGVLCRHILVIDVT